MNILDVIKQHIIADNVAFVGICELSDITGMSISRVFDEIDNLDIGVYSGGLFIIDPPYPDIFETHSGGLHYRIKR